MEPPKVYKPKSTNYGGFEINQDWRLENNPTYTGGDGDIFYNTKDPNQAVKVQRSGTAFNDIYQYLSQYGTRQVSGDTAYSGSGKNLQSLEAIAEKQRQADLFNQIKSGQISESAGTKLANNPPPIANQIETVRNNSNTGSASSVAAKKAADKASILAANQRAGYTDGTRSSRPQITNQNQALQSQTPSFALTGGQNLKVGSSGNDVSNLQKLLGGLTVDGKYGPKTQAAVIAFQKANGLKPDGIVGPLTAAALAKQGQPQGGTQGGQNAYDTQSGLLTDYGKSQGLPEVNIGSQLGAVGGTNSSAQGDTTGGIDQSALEKQYASLLGLSKEETAAQKAETEAQNNIKAQENALRQGVQNVGEQPIAMSFISGQQADLEKRNVNLQIPLQEKLANAQRERALAQEKRMASLDSIKFQLERGDKKTERADTLALEREKLANKSPSEQYGTGAIGEYNFAKSQGYTGSFADYQNEDANRKATIAKAGATSVNNVLPSTQNLNTKETADALMSVNQINNVLSMPDFDSAFGAKGIINRKIPGSPAQNVEALVTQILDKAAVAARGQLKGQGQVSNFEVQMLKNAQSALSNYQISPTAARQALIDMQGAIQTSTGGKAKIRVIDQKTGESKITSADSRSITKLIADGFKIQYTR